MGTSIQVKVNIDTKEAIELIKKIALGSYGVAAISLKSDLSANSINQTKKGKKEDAIFVTVNKDQGFSADVYLVVSTGVKITEIISETQKAILFGLKKKYKTLVKSVNVYAENVSSSLQ